MGDAEPRSGGDPGHLSGRPDSARRLPPDLREKSGDDPGSAERPDRGYRRLLGAGAPTDRRWVRKLEIMARATATALDSAQVYASLSDALERRKFLLRELDHRCKNTLAAVQSIADQTLRRAISPGHFVEAFNGRIGALGRAHELLTRGAWGNAKLSEVIGQALTPFCGAPGLTIAVSGPDIALTPETAVAMHLTVHELAVNATKYGALSVAGGRLDVAWSVDHAERAIDFRWVERGGPPVTTPASRGFGSRLIEHGVGKELGGRSEMLFDPEGLQFHMRAPLSGRISLA